MLKVGDKVKHKDWSDDWEGIILDINLGSSCRQIARVKAENQVTKKIFTDYYYLNDLIKIFDYDESWI